MPRFARLPDALRVCIKAAYREWNYEGACPMWSDTREDLIGSYSALLGELLDLPTEPQDHEDAQSIEIENRDRAYRGQDDMTPDEVALFLADPDELRAACEGIGRDLALARQRRTVLKPGHFP